MFSIDTIRVVGGVWQGFDNNIELIMTNTFVWLSLNISLLQMEGLALYL